MDNKEKKEKIPLFAVYRENGVLKTQVTEDITDYELYGFLNCFIKHLEFDLIEIIKPRGEDE